MRVNRPDFIQINYSLMDRAAAQRILPLAQEMRIAVLINRPFSGGGIFRVLAWQTAAGVGGGIRLSLMGAVFVERDCGASGGRPAPFRRRTIRSISRGQLAACIGRLPNAKTRAGGWIALRRGSNFSGNRNQLTYKRFDRETFRPAIEDAVVRLR